MTQQSHSQAYILRKQKLKTCIPLFTAALFTIARTWKQPRCPSTDEWIKKLWYIYTMEYYSAIKRNAFESVLMRQMNLEPIIQSEVSQKEKYMGRGEERVICMERVTWKLTLPYVNQIAKGNLLYVSGNSNRVLYHPRWVGWGGRWEGGPKQRGYIYTYG